MLDRLSAPLIERRNMPYIYVLETEPGKPPRALVGEGELPNLRDPMAVFSPDMGCWTIDGIALPEELQEAITDHARSLGVPGFE